LIAPEDEGAQSVGFAQSKIVSAVRRGAMKVDGTQL
jgi:hypothetical protein